MRPFSSARSFVAIAFLLSLAGGASADAPASPPHAPASPPHASASPPPRAPLPALPSVAPSKPKVAPPASGKRAVVATARTTKPASARSGPKNGARTADPALRRMVAGGPTADDVAFGAETPELHALHEAELELFPPAIPALGTPWPSELASPLSATESAPRVHASGLPPPPPPTSPRVASGGRDVSWLSRLELPDLPVRWDARLVRYLEFYKDDPRGRQLMTFWIKRSGRYRDAIRRSLRKKALPEDLSWLPMVESGYDAVARSPAGAAGLWQLTADTAHLYGLSTDRWADQRLNAQVETEAAVEMLSDLYRRFGSWELAMASYNMGYGGVTSVVRRYNTNDYWALSKLEAALPWETVLYVPKVVAAAIVGRNLALFGFADVVPEPPIEGDDIRVAPGTPLSAVAEAAGCTLKDVEALNLELRAGRTPPAKPEVPGAPPNDPTYLVKVPLGRGAVAQANLAKSKDQAQALERYVVKFGESLEQIAAARKVATAKVVELNAIAPGEVVRGGTVLLVPKAAPSKAPEATVVTADGGVKPVAIIPPEVFVYPDRKRVFYRVLTGDTLGEIAAHLHVDLDDLRRWNDLDPSARLQEGMTLQVFVPDAADLSHTVLLGERDARILVAGSDEFFAYWEGTKGKKRLVVAAKAGETIESIGRKHGVPPASMERINGRGRRDPLKEGEHVVVYLPAPGATPHAPPSDWESELAEKLTPVPSGPLPLAPDASLLPRIP